MKVFKETLVRGRRRITVELDSNETLMAINPDDYYRLGGQVEDIVQGHVVTEAYRTYWCSVEQKWV